MSSLFADILLPLPLQGTFTYRVPHEMADTIRSGMRVIVPFGQRKKYTGIVIGCKNTPPELEIEIKEIITLLDDQPVVPEKNRELWKWIANYYVCSEGEVMKAALPAGLRPESETVVTLAPGVDPGTLPPREEAIARLAENSEIRLGTMEARIPGIFSYYMVKKLFEQKILIPEEAIIKSYKPLYETMVLPHPGMTSTERWEETLLLLKNAPRQKELMAHFALVTRLFSPDSLKEISRKQLLEETPFTPSLLRQLVNRNILTTREKEISRVEYDTVSRAPMNPLTNNQFEAMEEIKKLFLRKNVVLLHGITASGKTEIYIHLIADTLAKGKQVLYLVPEISLTPQIINRLVKVFGGKTAVYHSRMGSPERAEVWQKVVAFHTSGDESCQIILGARSALFLPFARLGLIIVDEEHDYSYKQSDPAPRYHARDMAVVTGMQHQAPVLLGSATPSFESYRNATSGKYGLVTLWQRFRDAELPAIIVADLKRARKRKEMKSLLTPELFGLITSALQKKEQVILFQNRRGYSPWIECQNCGWIPKCRYCDVSLSFHRNRNSLKCHYCGYQEPLIPKCPECGNADLKYHGFGTEKVEEEIAKLFPEAHISRMDLDTTRSKESINKIITQLETGKTDILIGTQMVTKGLDFPGVSVVGILYADNLLSHPDFRASERAFQLLVQVSGRPGRGNRPGAVVIQTTQPEHKVVMFAKNLDYTGLYNDLMSDRQLFNYPPFFRLVKISVRDRIYQKAESGARFMASLLKSEKSIIILGPQPPLIGKINRWHIFEIWLKLPRSYHPDRFRRLMETAREKTVNESGNSSVNIQIDVDAY